MEFIHQPVLLKEVVEMLSPEPGMSYLDATIGGAGHATAIGRALGQGGRVFGIDRDESALAAAEEKLSNAAIPHFLAHGSFGDAKRHLQEMGEDRVDLLLADLGVSSPQVDTPTRGFSYGADGPLDMRMDPTSGVSAAEWLAAATEEEISWALFTYGEERFSRKIARMIVRERDREPIVTTQRLVEVIRRAFPAGGRKSPGHPARRTFQALRIVVNRELDELPTLLASLPDLVKPGGRAAIISFHSLEDRMVKEAFKLESFIRLTRKPVVPTPEETEANPRARSAKLRAVILAHPEMA